MKAFVSALMAGFALWLHPTPACSATNQLYFTQFEPEDGFNSAFYLTNQAGWEGTGSGGNGILTNGITGQSAYLGFYPPAPTHNYLTAWHPINFNPVTAGYPLVKFSVVLRIQDSLSTTNRDIFSWIVYNQQFDQLFAIDFDNKHLDVSYWLDGTNDAVFPEDLFFDNNSNYTLNVTMNFASNLWSANYSGSGIATNRPITTTNAPLTLGDVDAGWFIRRISYTNGLGQVITTNAPGDNMMIFDNYRLTAETLPVTPAQVQFLGRTTEGWALLRVFGDNGSRWALEATTNFVNWTAVKTNPVSGTYYDQVDTTAAGNLRRFYRARHVP